MHLEATIRYRSVESFINKGKHVSPYNWYDTLTWFRYFFNPSMNNAASIPPCSTTWKSEHQTKDRIKLVFSGDLMATFNYQLPEIDGSLKKILCSADLTVINCEGVLCDQAWSRFYYYNKMFRFAMPVDYIHRFFEHTGLSHEQVLLNYCNNHSLDLGIEQYIQSQQLAKNQGLQLLGPKIAEQTLISNHACKDLSLGFLSWTHLLNRDDPHAKNLPLQTAQDILHTDIKALKQKNQTDFLIAMPHWDFEFRHYPCIKTRQLATQLANSSIDLTIGSHPHIIQPVENINDNWTFYSLGDFVFCPLANQANRLGAFLEVDICWDEHKQPWLAEYTLHFFVHEKIKGEKHIVPLEQASSEIKHYFKKRIAALFTK